MVYIPLMYITSGAWTHEKIDYDQSTFFDGGNGTCAVIIAKNTRMQPVLSLRVRLSPSSSIPEKAANTDSRLMIMQATEARANFCPTICRVKAMPDAKTPAYIMCMPHLKIA